MRYLRPHLALEPFEQVGNERKEFRSGVESGRPKAEDAGGIPVHWSDRHLRKAHG